MSRSRSGKRRKRATGLLTGLSVLSLAALLSACDKPQPTVTVFNGSDSAIVKAQPVCTVQKTDTCDPDPGKVVDVTADAGSTLLVDVPKKLADAGWFVSAFTSDGKTNTPINTPGVGSANVLRDHTVRLQVPQQTTGSYYLQVVSMRPSRELTNWLITVHLSQ
jgi:hypothetical protein